MISFLSYNSKKARELFRSIKQEDNDKLIVMELIKNDDSVETQAKKYYERTGKSRRTFFRIKNKLSAKVPLKSDVAHGTKLGVISNNEKQ